MRGRMTSRARAQRLRAIQAQNVKLAEQTVYARKKMAEGRRAAMLDKLVERYIARYGHGV
ncbi:MAG: hypothetical protein MR935_01830 [Agathobaculum sp.]|uniref:hypothetical protein n=1 Tax=Agathobaculum sp. TaxID=2048138 RepID=UPI0025C3F435|nr:hypothetical protein [Agathobaculum sp.]MCI7124933.1 hypothetical protein [Agathobaculum sp.]